MPQGEPSGLLGRPIVVSTTLEGLEIDTDGATACVPWRDIVLVMAAVVANGAANVMLLTFETRDGRVLILSELEPAWADTADTLPLKLRGARGFSDWGPSLVKHGDLVEIYEATD